MINNFTDTLGQLHGKKPTDIYVLLSKDGSTVVMDPGLNRPWSSPNKRLAEFQAAEITKQGHPCSAVTVQDAVNSIVSHPENQPPK